MLILKNTNTCLQKRLTLNRLSVDQPLDVRLGVATGSADQAAILVRCHHQISGLVQPVGGAWTRGAALKRVSHNTGTLAHAHTNKVHSQFSSYRHIQYVHTLYSPLTCTWMERRTLPMRLLAMHTYSPASSSDTLTICSVLL